MELRWTEATRRAEHGSRGSSLPRERQRLEGLLSTTIRGLRAEHDSFYAHLEGYARRPVSEPTLHLYAVLLELALAVPTFVALLRLTAPYGRHARRGWDPSSPRGPDGS